MRKLDTMDSCFLKKKKNQDINVPEPKHFFFLKHILLLLCQNLASTLHKIQLNGLSEIQTC